MLRRVIPRLSVAFSYIPRLPVDTIFKLAVCAPGIPPTTAPHSHYIISPLPSFTHFGARVRRLFTRRVRVLPAEAMVTLSAA